MKITYTKPMLEVTELNAFDIIRTSGLTETINDSGTVAGMTGDSYDDAYNLSAGGKIKIK